MAYTLIITALVSGVWIELWQPALQRLDQVNLAWACLPQSLPQSLPRPVGIAAPASSRLASSRLASSRRASSRRASSSVAQHVRPFCRPSTASAAAGGQLAEIAIRQPRGKPKAVRRQQEPHPR